MGRHELREQTFILLFRAAFHDFSSMNGQMNRFFEESELFENENDVKYVQERVNAIMEKLPELDKLIEENTEGWNIDRIGKVELTIMRLAIYEINYDDTVPGSVAINEAVELAKKYSSEASGGFVNAILAKIVKPGDQNS